MAEQALWITFQLKVFDLHFMVLTLAEIVFKFRSPCLHSGPCQALNFILVAESWRVKDSSRIDA